MNMQVRFAAAAVAWILFAGFGGVLARTAGLTFRYGAIAGLLIPLTLGALMILLVIALGGWPL